MPSFTAANSPRIKVETIPRPVSVTLCNLLPPHPKANTSSLSSSSSSLASSNRRRVFRPDHSYDLLVSIRLDIFVKQQEQEAEEVDSKEPVNGTQHTSENQHNREHNGNKQKRNGEKCANVKEVVIYSFTQTQCSINSLWDHLDERVTEWEREKQWIQHSHSTFIRLVLVPDSSPQTSSKSDMQQQQQVTNKEIILIHEFPLQPKLLRRLPEDDRGSWGQTQNHLPKSLPPNSVIVHYSDDSARVDPALFHLLSKRGIIDRDETDITIMEDDEEENRRTTRFDDSAFCALDLSTTNGGKNTGEHKKDDEGNKHTSSLLQQEQREEQQQSVSRDSLLETDDESLATPVASLSGGTVLLPNDQVGGHDVSEATKKSRPLPMLPSDADTATVDCCQSETKVVISDLKNERAKLESLIAQEEAFLAAERKLLEQGQSELQATIELVANTLEESDNIEKETRVLKNANAKIEVETKALQLKLVRELQLVYPIKYLGDPQRYQILTIELPADFQNVDISEDEVSAALGFICHVVVMMSKYLNVPLRYRVVCNSSRSAIQEDGAKIMPLFQSRVVERDQLDRGLLLLHRNVDCLLASQGLACPADAHILGKLKRIYDAVSSS